MSKNLHIIMGNGVNQNFDKNPKRWNKFTSHCYKEFSRELNKLNESNNKKIKSIYKISELIINHFGLVKNLNTSIEDIIKYFKINNYRYYFKNIDDYLEFMFKIFSKIWTEDDSKQKHTHQELWNYFLNEIESYLQVPGNTADFHADGWIYKFNIDMPLMILNFIYRKSIDKILFKVYKVNDINIPLSFINFINKNYSIKITLNFDRNLDKLNDLIKLHGSIGRRIMHYKKNQNTIRAKKLDKDLINLLKKNKLSYDMVLGDSDFKEELLRFNNYARNYGIKKAIKEFNIFIDNDKYTNNLVINPKQKSYGILDNLEGEVHIIGVSISNDEQIFKSLEANEKVTKIIYYSNMEVKLNYKKLENVHYNEFWNNYETYKKELI